MKQVRKVGTNWSGALSGVVFYIIMIIMLISQRLFIFSTFSTSMVMFITTGRFRP